MKAFDIIIPIWYNKNIPIWCNQDKEKQNEKNDAVVYRGKASADWSKYASGEAVSVVTWKYTPYRNEWEYSGIESEDGNFSFTDELEGKWSLYNENGFLLKALSNLTISCWIFQIKM